MRRWLLRGFLILLSVVLLAVALYYLAGLHISHPDRILPGVKVRGLDFSDLNRQAAERRLQDLEKHLQGLPVVLKYRDASWQLPMDQIGLKIDLEQTFMSAYGVGRQGPFWQQWQQRRQAQKGVTVPLAVTVDQRKLKEQVDELTQEIILPPRDAALTINADNSLEVSPGRAGRLVDMKKLQGDLMNILQQGSKPEIILDLAEVQPAHTTDEIKNMGINCLLGTYATSYDNSNANRAYNISVAAAGLDGLVLKPGEVLSFNKEVGPRSTEAGYKTAKVILNDELVDGLGGGVCQVSTTLYNAVLLANLEIVERYNHTLPISYVPIGRDATVVFQGLDFKFRNNTGSCLYIQAYANNGKVTIKIFGSREYKKDVRIRSWVEEVFDYKTVEEPDANLKKGERVIKQPGIKGCRVATERLVLEKGQVVKTERLPNSLYNSQNEIIAVGSSETDGPVFSH